MENGLSLTPGVDGLFFWKPEYHQGTVRTVTAPFWSLINLPFLGWSVNWINKADQAVTASSCLPRFLKQLKLPTVLSSFLFKSMWKCEVQWEGVSLQQICIGLIKVESCIPLFFFSEECLIGLISRLCMWVTMFSSKQGRKGHSAGHYGAPCQPVLLHASLPISLAKSAPNKQVTNELVRLALFLYLVFPTKTITCFYALDIIQRQEVKGRRGRNSQKYICTTSVLIPIDLIRDHLSECPRSRSVWGRWEAKWASEELSSPRGHTHRQLPLLCEL